MATTLETLLVDIRADTARLRTDLNRAVSTSERASNRMATAFRSAGAALAAVGVGFAADRIIRGIGNLASEAQRAENQLKVFNNTLARFGQDSFQAEQLVTRLSDRFGVLPETIREGATLLLRAGADLEDVERAFTAAGASAAATGFDISQSFENVAVAVATGRSELLETSGIVANLGPVTQAYARSVGKTVEELTEQEKAQARINAIYEESRFEIEDLDTLLTGLTANQNTLRTEFTEFSRTLGEAFLPAVNAVVGGVADLLGGINNLVERLRSGGVQAAAQNVYEALAGGSTESVVAALDEVIERVGVDGNSGARDALTKLREDLIQTGDVSVEQAARIVAAFADLDLANRGRSIFGIETLGNAERQIRRVGNQTQGDPEFFLRRYETALNNLDFEGALEVVRQVQAAAEASGGRLAEFNRDLVPLLDAFDAFFAVQANLPDGVVQDRGGATGAASTAGGVNTGSGGGAPTGTQRDPVAVRFAGPTSFELGVRGLGRRDIGAPDVSARILPQSEARQFTVPTSYEQAGRALADGFVERATQTLFVPEPTVGGGVQSLVAPNVRQTGTLEPTESIANLRVELSNARAEFEAAATDAARQSIAQKIVELEEAIAALERARTPVALGVTPVASGRGPAVTLPVPEPTITGQPLFVDTGVEGIASDFNADVFDQVFQGALRSMAFVDTGSEGVAPEFNAAVFQRLFDAAVRNSALVDTGAEGVAPAFNADAFANAFAGALRRFSFNDTGGEGVAPAFETEVFAREFAGALRNQAFVDTGAEGVAPAFDAEVFNRQFESAGERFSEEARQSGLAFATTVVNAGQTFSSAIASFQAGDVGGGIAGLGSVASSIAALIPGGAAIAPLIAAGSSLLGGLVNLGSGQDAVDEASSAQSRRNLSQLELNFTFNQTNSLGLLDDPNTTRKLQENAESAFRRFEDIIKRNINPRLDALEARI